MTQPNILMLSLATDILAQPLGDGRERHADYASRIEHLHMLIYGPRALPVKPEQVSDQLTLYNSHSRSRYLFAFDALRQGLAICRQQPINLIATQDPFMTGLAGVWLKQRTGLPLQVNNHATFFDNPHWLAENPLRHRVFERLGKWVVRQADTLRTVNAHQQEYYVRRLGVAPERVEVINTPINLERFSTPPEPQKVAALRARLAIPLNSPVILWAGRPAARTQKNLALLLEAFAIVRTKHPGAILLLAGDTYQADYLPAAIQQRGLQASVLTPGSVPHAELPLYYALCDVFALSSTYEGMPKVVAEAAASGKPVVSTRIPGLEDAVLHGKSGLLCEAGNAQEMAGHLDSLLSDPARAAALGKQGRDFALERFDRERSMAAIVALWQRGVQS